MPPFFFSLPQDYQIEVRPSGVARTRSRAPRRPVEIARENAEEGCVRETFGALLAAHQAAYACDPEVREVMTRIAGDELRHAALALLGYPSPERAAELSAHLPATRRWTDGVSLASA